MRIHFIAIGGSIMHSLALAMHEKGHKITGSDDEIYEPSRSRLAQKGILPPESGWFPDKIDPSIDLVVLGMHARVDNPELLKAKSIGIRIQSFPEFIFDLSVNKIRVVVAGSHGKTTTSGMIAHVLNELKIPADRMIGAAIGTLVPVQITDAGIIILEGDEYLSSPDDSRPKFLHYHPQFSIITGIAWDHMNVFPTYQSYIEPFRQFILSLGKDDTLIYCKDDADLVKLVAESTLLAHTHEYGIANYEITEGQVSLSDQEGNKYPLQVFGIHNMQNIGAAYEVCRKLGVSDRDFLKSIQSFNGANKRLELLYRQDQLTAYLDFAHAPSKVKATVHAVREKHPESFIIACLELHTFSSLNPDFLPQYKNALKDADVKIVYYSPHTLVIKKLPDLSSGQLADYFNASDLQVVTTPEELERKMNAMEVKKDTVMLWMSSGRFDGLDLLNITKAMHIKITG